MGGGTTLYDELEVSPSASADVIQGAYRSLVKRYHPDRNPGDESAAERMQRINDAYAVLGDPEKRAAHDAGLAEESRRQAEEEAARRAVELDRVMRQRYSEANLGAGLRAQRQAAVAPPRRRSPRIGAAIAAIIVLVSIGVACLVGMAWLDSKESEPRGQPPPVQARAVAADAAPKEVASVPVPAPAPTPALAPPRLSSADEVTIGAACNGFQAAGDLVGFRQCRETQLAIAATATPVPLDGVPAETVNAIGLACRHYQMAGDLAGHRKCLSERLAEAR
jgi:hypothetical protein